MMTRARSSGGSERLACETADRVYLEVVLCLPREARTIGLVRSAITNILVPLNVTPECVDDICLAVSEACTNVIVHAESNDEYEVVARADGQQCHITVRNSGVGFDAKSLDGLMPSPRSVNGRGVAIMRTVMDRVELASRPQAGTVVRLERDLAVTGPGPFAVRSKSI
jgi:serine/threonine-protein kinase RsbW